MPAPGLRLRAGLGLRPDIQSNRFPDLCRGVDGVSGLALRQAPGPVGDAPGRCLLAGESVRRLAVRRAQQCREVVALLARLLQVALDEGFVHRGFA